MQELSQIFGKTAFCGVVGSERKKEGLGNVSPAGSVGVKRSPPATNAPTSKNRPLPADRKWTILRKGYPFPMLAAKLITLQNKERTGKEWNRNESRKQQILKQSGTIPLNGAMPPNRKIILPCNLKPLENQAFRILDMESRFFFYRKAIRAR